MTEIVTGDRLIALLPVVVRSGSGFGRPFRMTLHGGMGCGDGGGGLSFLREMLQLHLSEWWILKWLVRSSFLAQEALFTCGLPGSICQKCSLHALIERGFCATWVAWRTLATARSFIFSCGLRNVACEICVKDNTDEISADGKIDYEADVQGVVMNFDLFIEESSSLDSWSVCAYDEFSDAVLGACFTSDPKWKVACETRARGGHYGVGGLRHHLWLRS